MKILGVSGSLRTGSHNTALLAAFARCVERQHAMSLFDRAKEIPVFDEDIETVGPPPAVEALCA